MRVLVVEDEESIRDTLTELFDLPGNETRAVGSLPEAQRALAAEAFDLVVTDLRLGDRRDGGLQVLGACGLLSPAAAVVVLTAFPIAENRQAAMRLGATYFLEKPVDLDTIATLVAQHGVGTSISPVGPETRSDST